MPIKHVSFRGGYRFRRFLGQPERRLEEAPPPARAVVPLLTGEGTPIAPSVKKGETILAGRLIARDDTIVGAPVIASVGGTVEEIRELPWYGAKARAVVIRSDGGTTWAPVPRASAQWPGLGTAELEELLYLSGATALAAGGIPTRYNSSRILPEDVEHLVVHHLEAEPFNPDLQTLLDGRTEETVAEGLAILAKVLPKAQLHLVASRQHAGFLNRVRRACGNRGLQGLTVHTASAKYPQAHEAVLLPSIVGALKREYPHGVPAVHLGAVVLDLQGLLQTRDVVVEGKPVIDRIVALCGPGFRQRPHLRLRLGTPVGDALQPYLRPGELRLVRNSALSGESLPGPDTPLDAGVSCIVGIPEDKSGFPLAFARPGFLTDSYSRTFAANFLPFPKGSDTNIHGEHRPCISCGYCEQVCPVGILPYLLHRYVQRGVIDETPVRYGIFRCIDCNLCTYVCTSKIPLARLMRDGKARLRAEGLSPDAVHRSRFQLKGLAETRGKVT